MGRARKEHVMDPKKWIQGAIKNPGGLHKALKISPDKKIPAQKLEKAAHSNNPKIRKMATLAETLKGFKHPSMKKGISRPKLKLPKM